MAPHNGTPRLMARDLPGIMKKHQGEMLRRGRSPATIAIYTWGVTTLTKYIGNLNGQAVDRELLEGWQDSLIGRLSLKSRSVAATSMHQLLKWAADREPPLCDPRLERAIVGVKVNRAQPRPLHPNDLTRIEAHLIERCDPRLAALMGERPPTVRDFRDRALFHYIIATGGRVSEILQVHRDTFDREVIRQKGGGDKELICQPGVAGLIHQYLTARTDDLKWLWIAFPPGQPIRRLDPAGVLQIWARLADAYMVPRFTTHRLRHTAASRLADRGHGSMVIAHFLGHRDERSVHVYAKMSLNRLASARADLDIAT